MTTNNTHITELCDQLVAAVRQDIRQELTAKLREEFGAGVATGMHGEPINQARQKTRGQRGPDKRPFRPNSSLARVYRTLAVRRHGPRAPAHGSNLFTFSHLTETVTPRT